MTEFLDVDVDRISYFELRDYIKELGYTIDCDFFIKWDGLLVLVDNDKVIFNLFNMVNDGDTVKVYVFHWVSEANKAPLELEFVPHVTESGVGEESFNETSNPNNQPPTSTFPSILQLVLLKLPALHLKLSLLLCLYHLLLLCLLLHLIIL